MDPFEQPPSPAKNFLGGGGCGCGCLGLLMVLVALVFGGALYSGAISTASAGSVWLFCAIAITVGLLTTLLGVLLWIVSIVLD
jgi:hypothetical protein